MRSEPGDVISFWIADGDTSPEALKRVSKTWYRSKPAFDDEIRTRFGDTLALAEQGDLPEWRGDAEGELALVILLDQFSRNLYRGTPDAWRNDTLALEIASDCVESERYQALTLTGRLVLYHPFHHAESITEQERACALYEQEEDNADEAWKPEIAFHSEAARGHREIVRQFGRFPHRNAALGRSSTPAETDHLSTNKKRYGQ